MKIKNMLFIALFLLLFVPFSYAWKWETHEYLAEQVCNQITGCMVDCIKNGSVVPDRDFNDFINHHVYRECKTVNAEWCENGECQDCSQGDMTDDIAITRYVHWISKSKSEADLCTKFYDLGIATHYFFDSKVFFHQTKGEKESCHNEFENNVNERIKNKDYSNWTECACGVCVNFSDFENWETEFMSEKNRLYNLNATKIYIVGQSDSEQNIIDKIVEYISYYWNSLWRGIFGNEL